MERGDQIGAIGTSSGEARRRSDPGSSYEIPRTTSYQQSRLRPWKSRPEVVNSCPAGPLSATYLAATNSLLNTRRSQCHPSTIGQTRRAARRSRQQRLL